jgi:hypothetical protein
VGLHSFYKLIIKSILPNVHNTCRLANIYPSSWLVNCNRKDRKQISIKFQHALWYSGKKTLLLTHSQLYLWQKRTTLNVVFYIPNLGAFRQLLWCILVEGLRGAMAFALALQSVSDLPNNGDGRIILTSTLFTIFFTVSLTWIGSHDSQNEYWRMFYNFFVSRIATKFVDYGIIKYLDVQMWHTSLILLETLSNTSVHIHIINMNYISICVPMNTYVYILYFFKT